MNKKWQIYQVNDEKVKELQKKYNINKLLLFMVITMLMELQVLLY